MCLLIFKPAGVSIPMHYLANASIANPDGSGVAYAHDGRLTIEKAAKWGSDEIHEILKERESCPAIVHFRWATHGSKNHANTHPFQLNDSWVAAHNGVIPNVNPIDDESDTRAFLRQNVIPLLDVGVFLYDKEILELLGKTMGKSNKMTFLCADGSYGIANESSGHWKDKVWYSNHSYLSYGTGRRYTPVTTLNPMVPRNYYGHGDYYDDGYNGEVDDYNGIPSYHYHSRSSRHETALLEEHAQSTRDDCYAPTESLGAVEEIWHGFDKTDLWCDNCNGTIKSKFKIDQKSGLCYGECCFSKI